MVDNFL